MLKKLLIGLIMIGLLLGLSGIAFGERAKVTFLISPGPSITAETYAKLETAFEAAYPNVDLIYETTVASEYAKQIVLRGAMGDLPDVFAGAWGARYDKYANAGLMFPLNDLMEAGGTATTFWFEKGRRSDGNMYAFPNEGGCRGFINYNKEMFDEAGIPYPTDDLTWEEFREMARKLTVRDEDGNVTRYGVFNKYPMYDFSFAFGGRLVDDINFPTKALFREEPYLAGMREYLDMEEEGTMMPRRTFDALGGSKPKIFAEGKVAIVVTGMGYGGWFKDSPFDWDVVLLPLQENGGYSGGSSILHVRANAEHPTEAFQFLTWFCMSEEAMILRQENYGANAIFPVAVELREAYAKIAEGRMPKNWKSIWKGRDNLVLAMVFEGVSDFQPIWWKAVMDIVYGRKPLESLIETAEECQEVLDQLPWNR